MPAHDSENTPSNSPAAKPGRRVRRSALPDPMPDGVEPARAAAVVDFCHALMNSAEFLYVE